MSRPITDFGHANRDESDMPLYYFSAVRRGLTKPSAVAGATT
jgi:hypothetical protein